MLSQKHYLQTLIILLLLFVLSACSPGPTSNVFTGTQGLELSFVTGFPEREVYELDPLPVAMIIRNQGTYDLVDDQLLVTWSYNPLYIALPESSNSGLLDTMGGLTPQQSTSSLGGTTRPIPQGQILYGRSPNFPEGDETYVEEYGLLANPIAGTRQAPTTTITAVACYEYETLLAREVCVDVDSFLRTGREQACTGRDLNTGTQGAPIAFTSIEVRAHPITAGAGFQGGVRPEFLVHVRNVGQGAVIAPPQESLTSACSLQDLSPEESGAVRVEGSIFNLPLSCNPGVVRLREGQGVTRCSIPEEHLDNPALAIQQNVIAVMELRASYVYRDSLSADVTIKRNPAALDTGFTRPDAQEVPGYVYEGGQVVRDSDGRPQTLCDAQGDGWSCSCDRNQCNDLRGATHEGSTRNFCEPLLCPGTLFCCNQEAYENFKNPQVPEEDDGEV